MAQTKVQADRWIAVIPSDTINIPNPTDQYKSSTATATTSNKLVDSAGDFVNLKVKIGDIIYNITDSTIATVTAVDSATTLSVSADIFANTEAYKIFRPPLNGSAPNLQIGTGGSVPCVSVTDDVETFTFVNGQFVPMHVKRVNSTGLVDATNIKAIW